MIPFCKGSKKRKKSTRAWRIKTAFRCVTSWGEIRENISTECSESLCCNYVSLPRNLCFPVRNLMFLLWKT